MPKTPKLIKLYWFDGQLWIDSNKLANPAWLQLPIYTSRGNKLYAMLEKRGYNMAGRACTVHRDNLFATHDMAIAHREALYQQVARV